MEFPNNVFIVYSLIINRSILRYVRMPADKEKHFLIPQVQFLTKVRPRFQTRGLRKELKSGGVC